MKIESNHLNINAIQNTIYNLVSNCNNFGNVLPEQLKNWESTEDSCSFEIASMAKVKIIITEKEYDRKVIFKATADQPMSMVIICNIIYIDNNSSEVFLDLDVDVPAMVSMMVKKPLENFANVLVDKIKIEAEKTETQNM